jgi:hypothetical protein
VGVSSKSNLTMKGMQILHSQFRQTIILVWWKVIVEPQPIMMIIWCRMIFSEMQMAVMKCWGFQWPRGCRVLWGDATPSRQERRPVV